MTIWPRLCIILVILACLPAVAGGQADKPRPKLLDGDLIEDGQPAPPPPPAQPAPENDTSQSVTLRKEFTVTLPFNPATGLGWKVASYDREFLQLVRTRYQKPEKPQPGPAEPPRQPGPPGQQFFDFLALKSGTCTIVFHYQRVLEKAVLRELRHTVTIK